jgi:hypothetical protein
MIRGKSIEAEPPYKRGLAIKERPLAQAILVWQLFAKTWLSSTRRLEKTEEAEKLEIRAKIIRSNR